MEAQKVRVSKEIVRFWDVHRLSALAGSPTPQLDDGVHAQGCDELRPRRVDGDDFCAMAPQSMPRAALPKVVNEHFFADGVREAVKTPDLYQGRGVTLRQGVDLYLFVPLHVDDPEDGAAGRLGAVHHDDGRAVEVARRDLGRKAKVEKLHGAVVMFLPGDVHDRRGQGEQHARPRAALQHVLHALRVLLVEASEAHRGDLRLGAVALPSAGAFAKRRETATVVHVEPPDTLV
mmetsp:Transcript_13668/g.36813  ORF Transcript_13668/g.36813 Transcript_13668/m.36813 type:complete len:233 (+) Transcript_13668:265-963(+)